jgi:hypothetical protein
MRSTEFTINESSNKLAKHYTTVLNSRFAQYDIPVKITAHFVDQMSNPRNQDLITAADIADFYSKLLIKQKKYLQNMPEGGSVQVQDRESDITVPMIKSNGVIVSTTVMRGDMRRGAQDLITI